MYSPIAMHKLTVILLFLISGFSAISQNASIRGKIADTAEKKTLANSVVALLRKSDSTFLKFTRADKDGNFLLEKLPSGNFLLLVTFPNFADYYSNTDLSDTSRLDLGSIPMILRSQLLEQVVVSQRLGAIRFKKDTTEYIADSFKVAQNANVEELLKRLPGIQVDPDGKIKAQGEEVKKVLVDGEEFFGDDPTMATQNLRADAIEKVQVFDKKSDQAAFTGIDDGQRTKTINLKMKEDKKNGYFGKIGLGGGLSDKFSNQAMINAFKGKRKFAAYGIMSNTGKTGLGWADRGAYGGGDNSVMEMEEGSGVFMITSSGDDFDGGGGSYYGEGLPTSWSAGATFSNKYDADRHKVNFNYKFNKLNTLGTGGTISQYNLGVDSFLLRNDRGSNFSQRFRNTMGGIYEVQLDSSSSLKLTMNGGAGRTNNANYSYSESLSGKNIFLNKSSRNTTSEGNNENFTSSLIWRKKFRKLGRTISVTANQSYRESDSKGFLNSRNEIFGSNPTVDTVDQQKINNSRQTGYSGKVSYTEPLTKKITLELNYSLADARNKSERFSYNKDNGKYDDLIDSLSNRFDVDILTHSGGANVRFIRKTINFSLGGNISHAAFTQKDLVRDTTRSYVYFNFFPRANFNWTIKPQTRLGIRYNGSTRQPTIDELQPIRDNTDLYNLRIGNPGLKQEFRHNIGLNFNDFKVLNNRGIWSYIDITTTKDAISTSDYIDSLGRRVFQPVNVSGNFSFSSYLSYSFKLKKSDFNIDFNVDAGGNSNNTIVNNRKNRTTNYRWGLGVGANYRKEKKIEFYLNIGPTYNTSKSSLNSAFNNNYWSTSIYGNFNIHLPWKLEAGSNIDIQLRQKTTLFPNNRNVALIRGNVSRKLFKDNSGVLKFEMNDIFNQNLGINRDVNGNSITERTYETLRRFWLLTFTWNFSKNGKAPTSPFD